MTPRLQDTPAIRFRRLSSCRIAGILEAPRRRRPGEENSFKTLHDPIRPHLPIVI